MAGMDFPSSPTNGQTTTDGRYYFDSSVGTAGGWRSTPLPVGGLPAGSIMAWGTNTPPANWLLADGSAVSRSVYSSLFAVIGTQYGTGDGTTTFNLPDLRGRVPVGKNAATFGTLGATGGAETHTLTEAQIPPHTHSWSAQSTGDVNDYIGGSTASFGISATYNSATNYGSFLSYTGGGQAHNILQPYQVVNYIIKASAGWTAGDSELATRIGVLEQTRPLSPNYVINGAFDIWQRGTSFIGTNYNYSADRWIIVRGGFAAGYTATRQASGLPGTQYCIRAQRDVGNTGVTDIGFSTAFESANSIPLAGKTVTLSFYARKGANYSATNSQITTYIHTGTGTDQAALNMSWGWTGGANSGATHLLTTSWARYSQTVTLPSNMSQAGIGFLGIPTGTAGASDYFEVTGVQLEEGSQPTAFRRNAPSIAAELAACQRYYVFARADVTPLTLFSSTDSWLGSTYAFFPVDMRTSPTITTWDTAGTSGNAHRQFTGSSGGLNVAVSVQYATPRGFRVGTSVAGATDRAGMYYLTWTASAEL